ncbi:MAG: hypothetical protein PHV18_10640 [Lachnospiraceae bacterium]|nr:hypothetical protein [Lachnospiraceae bacterium]
MTPISDEKPITARQLIQNLSVLAEAKPSLKKKILHELQTADVSFYKDSMRPLVENDIREAIQQISAL